MRRVLSNSITGTARVVPVAADLEIRMRGFWIRGFATAMYSAFQINHDKDAIRLAVRDAGLKIVDFENAQVPDSDMRVLRACLGDQNT